MTLTGTDHAAIVNPALDRQRNRRWLVLAVLALAQLMVVLDATIVNIALPTAQHALHFSNADRTWIVTGYALSFGSLLLLGGRVSDEILGQKRALLIGLVGFAAASAIGGASTSFVMLLIARIAQGVFGALLAPAALSLVSTTFTDRAERNRAFGIYGAIAGAGGAIGLILGGVLTSYLSWRYTLFVNVAIALIAAPAAYLLLSPRRAASREPLDWRGVASVSGGLAALVYGLNHAETTSWEDQYTLLFLGLGVALLTTFVLIERRAEHPLLPLRVVLNRNRGGALIALFSTGAAMFGVFLFLTYYLQGTLHYSPVTTGLAFLPMVGTLVMTAQVSTNLVMPRFGPKVMVASGALVAAVGMVLLTRTGLGSSYTSVVLPALLVLGAGFGFVIAPATSTATYGVKVEDAGVSSATVNTAQQVGGSIGTSLLNTLFAGAITSFLASHPGGPRANAALATIHGYHIAFDYSALFLVVGGTVCGLLLRRGAITANDQGAEAASGIDEPNPANLSTRLPELSAHA